MVDILGVDFGWASLVIIVFVVLALLCLPVFFITGLRPVFLISVSCFAVALIILILGYIFNAIPPPEETKSSWYSILLLLCRIFAVIILPVICFTLYSSGCTTPRPFEDFVANFPQPRISTRCIKNLDGGTYQFYCSHLMQSDVPGLTGSYTRQRTNSTFERLDAIRSRLQAHRNERHFQPVASTPSANLVSTPAVLPGCSSFERAQAAISTQSMVQRSINMMPTQRLGVEPTPPPQPSQAPMGRPAPFAGAATLRNFNSQPASFPIGRNESNRPDSSVFFTPSVAQPPYISRSTARTPTPQPARVWQPPSASQVPPVSSGPRSADTPAPLLTSSTIRTGTQTFQQAMHPRIITDPCDPSDSDVILIDTGSPPRKTGIYVQPSPVMHEVREAGLSARLQPSSPGAASPAPAQARGTAPPVFQQVPPSQYSQQSQLPYRNSSTLADPTPRPSTVSSTGALRSPRALVNDSTGIIVPTASVQYLKSVLSGPNALHVQRALREYGDALEGVMEA